MGRERVDGPHRETLRAALCHDGLAVGVVLGMEEEGRREKRAGLAKPDGARGDDDASTR